MTWNKITEQPNKKTSELLQECKDLFPVWAWIDFDDFDKHFPAPKEATTRTFEANIEADEKHKNKSYDDLAKEGIKGITLRERLIMELQYFKETGNHLDTSNVTLCSGSLYEYWDDRHVPYVRWDDGELCVHWYDRGVAYSFLRSREVVSGTLNPSSLDPSVLVASENIRKGDKVQVKDGTVVKYKEPEVCKTCERPL